MKENSGKNSPELSAWRQGALNMLEQLAGKRYILDQKYV